MSSQRKTTIPQGNVLQENEFVCSVRVCLKEGIPDAEASGKLQNLHEKMDIRTVQVEQGETKGTNQEVP